MENRIILYQTYEKDEADTIRTILQENEVDYQISHLSDNLQPIIGSSNPHQYIIYVNKELHAKAIDLIADILEKSDSMLDLRAYSDEEIKGIILNQNEWHYTFVGEAKKIAKERELNIAQAKEQKIVQDKYDKIIENENAKIEAFKEARSILFFIAGINIIIPIILIVPGNGVKILDLLLYLISALIYFCLGLWSKKRPLITSIIGLLLLLTAYVIIFIGDPSMIRRYIYLKISLVAGLIYAIVKSSNIKKTVS